MPRTAVSNMVARRLSQDSPPGTPEEYEPYRTALEDHVREQILKDLVERHPDWQEIAPARLLVVEDHVREFLEHHASRHPHPSRPRQKPPATGGASPAAQVPENKSAHEAILEGLKDECWKYVRDEGRRRRKRRGTESLSDRADGWQPLTGDISPSLAYTRTWAIDLWFTALAAWRATCTDEAGEKRWKLYQQLVIRPYYGSRTPPVNGPSARTVAGSEEDEPKEKPRNPSSFEAIYSDCGYDTRKKAYEAFGPAKIRVRRHLRAVSRERAARAQAGISEADLEARIEDDLQEFQAVLDEEVFWHHVALSDNEGLGEAADRRALRRYAEQTLYAAGALDETEDASETSVLADPPDLSQYDLCVIARRGRETS